jgi:glycosyltransferase involved in cell wall biosynthesis
MKIITYTSIFPDSTRPTFGIYIYPRMSHVASRPGNAVIVISPVPYVPFWVPGKRAREYRAVPLHERFQDLEVYHPRYPFIPKVAMPLHGFLMFLGSYFCVQRLVKQGADCIDAHHVYPCGFAAILLGKILKIPVSVSARGTDMNLMPQIRSLRPLLCWTVRRAQGLVGVCQALSDVMIELGAPRDRVRTIGNGVDTKRFYPIDQALARKQLDIPSDRPVIIAVGSLIPRKGFQFLIPTMAELNSRGVKARLYIVGEGEYRTHLERQIQDLDLSGQVVMTGSIPNEELRFWYSAADISCLSSSREGWPNVLMESLACGTPAVATRIWGTPEILISDELGVLVDQTVHGLANGLQSALGRVWNREKIAAHGRQRSWEVVAEEVEQWLAECTGLAVGNSLERSAGGVRA